MEITEIQSTNYTNCTNNLKQYPEFGLMTLAKTKQSKIGNPEPVSLIYKEEAYQIIGACMEVHNTLGCGFLEPVYQEALEYEFSMRGIPFIAQSPLSIMYKDRVLEKTYVADFIVFEKIVLEIKAVSHLDETHTAQVLNYLKVTGLSLGLLVNFGTRSLERKRIVK